MATDRVDEAVAPLGKLAYLFEALKNQSAVWSDFHLKTNASRPFMILIEPTLRCPMACKFCDYPTDTSFPKAKEMSLSQWKRILKELREFSGLIRDIFISGGEPFIRPDLCDLIEYAHQIGLGTRILTIGAFCDQAVCDRLLRSPMRWLKFSFLSADPSIHDRIVGRAVFEKAVGAINYLRSRGYAGKLGILTTVWDGNVRDVASIVGLAERLGVDGILFRPMFGNTQAVRVFEQPARINPEVCVREEAEIVAAVEELKELKSSGAPILNTLRQLDLIVEQTMGRNEGFKGCHMMYESMFIRPNGDLEVCGHMSLGNMGNVASARVGDVLKSDESYRARHRVSRTCCCQGNAFVRKSLAQKAAMLWELLHE